MEKPTGSEKKTVLKKVFQTLHGLLDEYAKKLEDEIDIIEDSNQKTTKTYQTQLNSIKKEASNAEDTIRSANNFTLVKTHKTLANNLEKMTEDLKALVPPVHITYDVKGIDQIQTTIRSDLNLVHIEQAKGKLLHDNH